MRDEEVDRALSGETDILPSSGFTRSVMDAVKRQVEAPRPIPFPWKRVVPAIVVGAGGFVILGWAAWSGPASAEAAGASSAELTAMLERMTHAAGTLELPWLLGVAALTLACALLGPRLTGRKEA